MVRLKKEDPDACRSLFFYLLALAISREVSFADVFYRHLRTRYRTGQTRAAGKTALLRFEH